jgi:Tfp pilus assembly protein PilF
MSRIKISPLYTLTSIARSRVARTISTIVLGGSTVALGAILWTSAMSTPRTAEQQPVVARAIPIAEPTPTPKTEPHNAPIVEEQPAETVVVDEKKIELAMPHEEEDETDYLALAHDQMDGGEMEKAFTSLRKHLFDHEPTAEIMLDLGRVGRQIKEYEVAVEALDRAAALDSRNADVQLELARVHLDAGDADKARVHAKEAIHLDPENAMAWNVAGRIAMKQSEWARGEAALKRAVELNPTNGMIHNNLGLLYLYTSRADDAVDALETAVELFGDDSPYFVYNNLGLAHEMAKDYEDARDAFEEALAKNPTYSRARVNLRRVLTTIAQREEDKTFETAKGVDPNEASDGEDTSSLRE